MRTVFGMNEQTMSTLSCTFTASEIYQQPSTWQTTYEQINQMKTPLQDFINQVILQPDYDVILTGAGTSEFIGNSIVSALNEKLDHKCKSYGTTDIMATPTAYLSKTKPTLLISFGRSGNSPESLGVVEVAEVVCEQVYHLFVTCNKNGALSKKAQHLSNAFAINLVDDVHDQSFAMTSSYTNMYLAAYLTFCLDSLSSEYEKLLTVTRATETFLTKNYTSLVELVKVYDFNRIVYLGSNVLKGVAQESALKMLELSAGRVVTMHDTPLGFRHGPKSIVNNQTLTVIYLSDDEYTRQYESDLIKEMSHQRKENKLLVVMSHPDVTISSLVDQTIDFSCQRLESIYLGLMYVTVAQVMGLIKSLELSLTPDNPCPTGEVNRVVQGVTIYEFKEGGNTL